jgi:nuclear pore complex protein Nup85
MSNSSLWQVGISYLDFCPQFGPQHLALHLDRLPVDSDVKAAKVLRIMEQRGLRHQSFSLCRVLAIRALKNERLGAALSWSIKSKDVAFASFVAEKLLTDYSHTGSFSHLDILDHLGPDMALSDKLAFLGKYREFHQLYENSEFGNAGQLLLSLLTAKLAPKRFWLMLLMDALPLLESSEVIFSVDDTYELLHCLEELSSWSKFNSDSTSSIEEEKLGLLRLALARNLARAMVEPLSDVVQNDT